MHNANTVNYQHHHIFYIIEAPARSSRLIYPVGVANLTYGVPLGGGFVLFVFKSQAVLDVRAGGLLPLFPLRPATFCLYTPQ